MDSESYAIRHGVADQLGGVIEEHRPEVLGYLRGRVGCPDAASDLFQSIIENLFRRPRTEPVRNIRAYLFQAARNAAQNHRRAEHTRAKYQQEAAPLLQGRDDLSPDRIVEGQEALAAVNVALKELPVLTRKMFLLYRVHGLKQQAIADQFGVHLSTVEKRIAKAAFHCHTRLQQ